MILLPWLTAGVWTSNNACFISFLLTGFLAPEGAAAFVYLQRGTAKLVSPWQSWARVLCQQGQDPESRQSSRQQRARGWAQRRRSTQRSARCTHPAGTPRHHREYLEDTQGYHPALRYTGSSLELVTNPSPCSAWWVWRSNPRWKSGPAP